MWKQVASLSSRIVPVVTRRTTQLNRSKMDRRASHGVREGFRMRDVLLTYDRLAPVEPQRSMPRWLTMLLDPVAAVLWRDPRRGKGIRSPAARRTMARSLRKSLGGRGCGGRGYLEISRCIA